MTITLLIPTIVVAVAIAVGVWRRWKERLALSLLIFVLALSIWSVAYTLSLTDSPPNSLFWLGPIYLSMAVVSSALLVFTFDYTYHKHWLTRQGMLVLTIEPAIVQVLFWIGYQRNILSPQYDFSALMNFSSLQTLNTAYCNILGIITVILLIQTVNYKPQRYLWQATIITVGMFIPIVMRVAYSWGIIAPLSFIPHPGEYIAVGVFIAVGIAIFKLPDSTLIGREVVVENMTEGWIVLDTHNRVVDINPAAERLIGLNRDKIFGQPAEQILENWPRLVTEQQNQDHELQGSIKIGEEWRYLQMRVSPLTSNQEMLGKVILWRDITDRKKALEARRRAREEMFVLLRSISSAALRSMNLNEFLKEAIYQIVYSFHSRASVIFLRSNGAQAKKKAAYYLAAQHGLSPQEIDYLSSSPQLAEILKQAAENQEPLSLSNLGADGKMPALLQGSGLKSILIAPMIFEEKVLGMIGLARGEGAPYGVDEIARLTVVAEEIASLISSDRERQRVIATEERERVVRDLHDSIAQELCTLVILTEAEQASIEAGTVHDPAEVLSRIAEHARQALKEMRLFLFEMRPVDLERQGLAAVLHQRLAAVEGLADIQARLVTDDKIDLSPEKEEALYYIAQEALNNVLKHAKAKNVTIHLVRRRGQIVLEIQDDGCGFNLKKALAKGGMGLENMRERAAKVNGKLRIVSSPQKGTKVIVSVSRG